MQRVIIRWLMRGDSIVRVTLRRQQSSYLTGASDWVAVLEVLLVTLLLLFRKGSVCVISLSIHILPLRSSK
jgi:hypothetical protein